MTRNNQTKLSVTGALLATALLTAQAVAQGPLLAAPRDADVGRFIVDQDGITTGGRYYRVHFGQGGMQFTPALGRQAPATLPLRFEFDSVLRGGQVVFEAHRGIEPQHAGHRVEYDRGHGVVERYDVRGDGVKQSFVFDSLPGSGDLVVRGRIATDLEATGTIGAERIDFLQGRSGGVTFDAVLGIDAIGQNAPGTMNWNGEQLELVLPAAFVDNARFPLILDPLIGSRRVMGNGGNDDSEADASYMETADAYLTAWERAFSNSDVEVRCRVTDAGNSNVTGWVTVTSGSNTLNLNPAVATVQNRGFFVIAWQAHSGALGSSDIWAAAVDATGTVATPTRVTSTFTGTTFVSTAANERYPDIANKANDSLTGTFIVWANVGVGIESRQISVAANGGITAAPVSETIATDADATRPRVSNGSPNQHAICWQSKNGNGYNTVKVSRVNGAGAINATIATISNNGSHRQSPDIDGTGSDFKLVFDSRASNGGILHRDVTFPANTTTLGSGTWVKVDSAQQLEPTIALVGPKYLVMWTEEAGFLDFEVHGRAITPDAGVTFCGDEFVVGGSNSSERSAAIATQRAGSDAPTSNDEALLVWNSADILTYHSNVDGQIYRPFVGATGVVLSQGCGSPVTLGQNGPVALGNADLRFELSTTDPAPGLGIFLFGFGATTSCPVAGGCTAINPIASTTGVFAFPTQTLTTPLGLPCDGSFAGLALQVQGLVLGSNAGTCAVFPSASLSSRYRFTLAF